MRLFGMRIDHPTMRGNRRDLYGVFIDALGGPTLFRSEYRFSTGAVVKIPGTVAFQPGPRPGLAADAHVCVYFSGGFDSGTVYTRICEHNFETKHFVELSATADTARQGPAAGANDKSAMFAGGYIGATPQSVRDLYTFRTKSVTQLESSLTTAAGRMSGTSDQTTALFSGGNDPGYFMSRRTSRYVFASDALTEVDLSLTVRRNNAPTPFSNGTIAAILWGFNDPAGWNSTVDEYSFSTDTCTQFALSTNKTSTGNGSGATDKITGVTLTYGTDKYDFATRAITQPVGVGINPSGYGMGGASNCHGGLV